MMQLGLLFDAPAAVPDESAENEHGVLVDVEAIVLPGKPIKGRFGTWRPNMAEIYLAFADGVWHWGINIYTSGFGGGFAPSRKWRRFAATRQLAIIDAATQIGQRTRKYSTSSDARTIERWLDEIVPGHWRIQPEAAAA